MNTHLSSNIGSRLLWQKVVVVLFVVFLSFAFMAFIAFMVWHFFGVGAYALEFKAQEFVVVIGMLFTFSSLIIALFGFINYFQSAEGLRRLTELELGFRSNARELIVMRVFVLFVSNVKVRKTIQDMRIAGSFLLHCFQIADSKDVEATDSEGIFEIEVSFLEILKMGGLTACKELLHILDTLVLHKVEYRTCRARFRKLIRQYQRLEAG